MKKNINATGKSLQFPHHNTSFTEIPAVYLTVYSPKSFALNVYLRPCTFVGERRLVIGGASAGNSIAAGSCARAHFRSSVRFSLSSAEMKCDGD